MIHFSSLNENMGSTNLMDCCKHIKRSSIGIGLGIDYFNFEHLIVQMSKSIMALKDINALHIKISSYIHIKYYFMYVPCILQALLLLQLPSERHVIYSSPSM